MTSLLPPNASPLERLIEAATALDARAPHLGIVRTAKMDADPRLIPWLLWEYGLGELLPWLADPRRALNEGIRFHRLRGTPASLAMALGWLGMDAALIEEHGPGRARISFEFQIDPGRVLNSDEARAVVAVAALAAPARSRLVRLYHGWDQRPFVLDRTPLGEGLISDFSGPLLDGVRQSFGLRHAATLIAPTATVALGVTASLGTRAWYCDRWMLDEMVPSTSPAAVRNWPAAVAGLTVLVSDAPPSAAPRPAVRSIPRAAVVLSGGAVLGDVNAVLMACGRRETGGPTILSGETRLSNHPHRVAMVPVLELFQAISTATLGLGPAPAGQASQAARLAIASDEPRRWPILSVEVVGPVRQHPAARTCGTALRGAWPAAWAHAPWPEAPWDTASGSSPALAAHADAVTVPVPVARIAGAAATTMTTAAWDGAAVASVALGVGADISPEPWCAGWGYGPWPEAPWDTPSGAVNTTEIN